MKYAKQQLIKFQQSPLVIDEKINLESLIAERFSDLIVKAPFVTVKGTLQALANEEIVLSAQVHAELVLPSSRSLAPVDWSTDFAINETYVAGEAELDRFEDDEAVFVLTDNSLDFDQVVLDNIIAILPSQILTPAETASADLPAGHDWQVISEGDFVQREQADKKEAGDDHQDLDPRLSKLDDFFNL